jgi:hypothetical protein
MSSALMITLKANEWVWSDEHNAPCRVIEAQRLWGQTTCRVWLPGKDMVVRVQVEDLNLYKRPKFGRKLASRTSQQLLGWLML